MTEEKNPLDQAVEQLLDLFVYAPIGLLYERDEVLPKLVTRGKSQVQIARVLSQLAVRRGQGQVEQRLVDALAAPAEELAKLLTELGARFGLAPPPDREGPASAIDHDAMPTPSDPAAAAATAEPAGTVPTPSGAVAPASDLPVDEPSAMPPAQATPAATEPTADPAPAATEPSGEPVPATIGPAADPARSATGSSGDPAPVRVPIAGYDQLRAREILPLLVDLSPAQRQAVREHEAAHRGRKTILNQIDRLGV